MSRPSPVHLVATAPCPAWHGRSIPSSPIAQFLWLLAAAIATRVALYGDPLMLSDEQFYLLVGDRMLQGAWPFVDIFDRKPVGLFVIFAGLRAIGGNGILVYQLGATLCAALTAFVVTRIARRFATPDAAFAAGLCYLVWLVVFDGAGGQSSVWYGLPMAGAALFALDGIRSAERLRARGSAAMLLVGIAMQIKYTAMFEGIFFALALLWAGRRADRSWSALVGDALIWMALALAPTLLGWAVYAAAGHGEAFFFANFLSIFGQRDADTLTTNAVKLAEAAALAAPLGWLAWCGHGRGRGADRPVLAWTGVALVAVLVMRSYEQHYFIPLMLPLSVASAAGLDHRRPDGSRTVAVHRGVTVLLIGVAIAVLVTGLRVRQRGTPAQAAELVRLIGDRPAGCLFGYNSEPILYYLTRSCLPTAYVFRSHLGQTIESKGIGVDPVAETARLLARDPGVIVMRERKTTTNPATEALVLRAVADRYRLVGVVRIGRLRQFVYRLRDAPPR